MRSLQSSLEMTGPLLRRLGQNLLIDEAARDQIVSFAELSRSDTVLEVGPGKGFLTEALIARAGKVIAVEKDPRLVSILRQNYRRARRLRVVEGDILKVKLPKFNKVVSCPPYYISSRLVLLLVSKKLKLAVLTLQKEFAERLTASPGSPNYGRISVMVQHKATVGIVGLIHRGSFRPVPRVDSAVVVIRNKKADVCVKSERVFGDLVRFLFTQRRKKARKVLRQYLTTLRQRGEYESSFVPSIPDVRVFQLTVRDFERFSNEISRMRHECIDGSTRPGADRCAGT